MRFEHSHKKATKPTALPENQPERDEYRLKSDVNGTTLLVTVPSKGVGVLCGWREERVGDLKISLNGPLILTIEQLAKLGKMFTELAESEVSKKVLDN